MSATVAQYPVEPHSRMVDDVSAAKKQMNAQVRAASSVVSPAVRPLSSCSATNLHNNNSNPSTPTGADERIALVLDMDECLVHSKFYNEVEYRQNEYRPTELQQYEDSFEIVMDDGERAVVHKRPGLDRFLEEASKHFDVYVFTAGLEAYGKPILDELDPKGTLFAGRFFRESCQQRKGMFLKDLRVVRKDLSKVILVDNNPVSFLLQPSNGIPVPSFYDDASDRTLDSLTKVLTSLRDLDDIRPRLHQLFRLADLLSEHQRMILS
jgi:CTD small phosphatase-like protein 2